MWLCKPVKENESVLKSKWAQQLVAKPGCIRNWKISYFRICVICLCTGYYFSHFCWMWKILLSWWFTGVYSSRLLWQAVGKNIRSSVKNWEEYSTFGDFLKKKMGFSSHFTYFIWYLSTIWLLMLINYEKLNYWIGFG